MKYYGLIGDYWLNDWLVDSFISYKYFDRIGVETLDNSMNRIELNLSKGAVLEMGFESSHDLSSSLFDSIIFLTDPV